MSIDAILLLGDPRLRKTSEAIAYPGGPESLELADRLIHALNEFRATRGFGLAIAGPQIGVLRRMVVLNLGGGPVVLINPRLTGHSDRHMTLWDSCMCFPFLAVRVKRSASVSIEWEDLEGRHHVLEQAEPGFSTLIQHEIDHLEGILAIDRAFGAEPIIARECYEQRRDIFMEQVDLPVVNPVFPLDRA